MQIWKEKSNVKEYHLRISSKAFFGMHLCPFWCSFLWQLGHHSFPSLCEGLCLLSSAHFWELYLVFYWVIAWWRFHWHQSLDLLQVLLLFPPDHPRQGHHHPYHRPDHYHRAFHHRSHHLQIHLHHSLQAQYWPTQLRLRSSSLVGLAKFLESACHSSPQLFSTF